MPSHDTAQVALMLRQNIKMIRTVEAAEQLDRLAVDLSDIRAICMQVQEAIEELLIRDNWQDPVKLRGIVLSLQGSFYVHLENHYESLRQGLEELLDIVPETRSDEELVDSIVNKVSGTLSKIRPKTSKN